jgi:hypothetical protein
VYRILSIISILVALTTSSVLAADTEVGSIQRIAKLHDEYRATTDYVDHLLIASKLARVGDFTYWAFVRREAQKAIDHDAKAHRSMPRIHTGSGKHAANPRLDLATDTSEQKRLTFRETVDVQAREYSLDVWRVQAFANGAPRTNRADKRLLQIALESPRPEISANAALGLARLHDVKSADDIKFAAARLAQRVREDYRLLFVEALVYLNDEHATRLAAELAGDKVEVLRSLQETAPLNKFDPFYSADE